MACPGKGPVLGNCCEPGVDSIRSVAMFWPYRGLSIRNVRPLDYAGPDTSFRHGVYHQALNIPGPNGGTATRTVVSDATRFGLHRQLPLNPAPTVDTTDFEDIGNRVVTYSPDINTFRNLLGFVNQFDCVTTYGEASSVRSCSGGQLVSTLTLSDPLPSAAESWLEAWQRLAVFPLTGPDWTSDPIQSKLIIKQGDREIVTNGRFENGQLPGVIPGAQAAMFWQQGLHNLLQLQGPAFYISKSIRTYAASVPRCVAYATRPLTIGGASAGAPAFYRCVPWGQSISSLEVMPDFFDLPQVLTRTQHEVQIMTRDAPSPAPCCEP